MKVRVFPNQSDHAGVRPEYAPVPPYRGQKSALDQGLKDNAWYNARQVQNGTAS